MYTPNDLILNPAGCVTAPRWDSIVELLLFAIEPNHLSRTAESAGASSTPELEMKFQFEDKLLEQLLRTLTKQFEAGATADPLYTESLTQTLLLHLLRSHTNAELPSQRIPCSRFEPRVRRAIEFIHANLAQTLSLEQIARAADLNPSQFSLIFKTAVGIPPHRYVLSQRVERAVGLLRHSKIPISEIATLTGFADQSHLTRLMRQQRGATPAQIRRQR